MSEGTDRTPEPCADWDTRLNSYLDGELDAVHVLEVERHLASCPACAAHLRRLENTHTLLASGQARWPVPEGLRESVVAALAAEAANVSPAASWSPETLWRRLWGDAGRTVMRERFARWSLVPSGGGLAVALVYRRNGHVINVFVWPGASGAHTVKSRDGYTLMSWSEAGLSYWAVSDLNPVELKEFQEDFTEALPK